MKEKKFIKVMFGNKGANYEYKIDEVNVASVWNKEAKSGKDMGGFNFSTEEKILRWLVRGDTLYDVIIPKNADVIDCVATATPHGVFRSNKIIITNPRPVTDEMAMEFYKKTTIPEFAYYKAMAGCAVRGYEKTAKKIFKDKVNKENIDLVISEYEDFTKPSDKQHKQGDKKLVNEIKNMLYAYKNAIKKTYNIYVFLIAKIKKKLYNTKERKRCST